MTETARVFEEVGYIKVESLIDKKVAQHIARQLEFPHISGDLVKTGLDDKKNVEGHVELYGYCLPILDHLLLELRKTIGGIVGKELLPTYSYFRKYSRGNILKVHKDRSSCEISCTLCLDQSHVWPFYVGDSDSIELNPGDAVLYKGLDYNHWRDAFEGDYVIQTFIHYVDSNGPYRDCFMDKRGDLYNIGKELNLY